MALEIEIAILVACALGVVISFLRRFVIALSMIQTILKEIEVISKAQRASQGYYSNSLQLTHWKLADPVAINPGRSHLRNNANSN
jgi:hypothetical protein